MHILIGIITVPAADAQAVADLMVAGGIRAIWNFAPIRLHTPAHVIVHNEDLYCSLAALSQKLLAALQNRPQPTALNPTDRHRAARSQSTNKSSCARNQSPTATAESL